MSTRVRPPAVAGTFYPRDAGAVATTVDALLADARARAGTRPPDPAPPRALVVPHAGYPYSGPVAASAYATLTPFRDSVRRVVLLGPAHRVAIDRVALPATDAFLTPLGEVAVDRAARAALRHDPAVVVDDRPHAAEHSLEVQLPFLQRVLADFAVVPLVVGSVPAPAVARVLEEVWGGPETVVVVSSDLSHYEPHAAATRHDETTARAVPAYAADAIGPYDACGVFPLRGLLEAAMRRGLVPELLDLRTSGDTAGDRARVVGYGAFVLRPAGGEP
jgi:hypothetical protein